MKKLFLAIAMTAASLSASAIGLESVGIANHLGAGVSVGTNGIGLEVATPITRFVQARVGVSYVPNFSFKTDADIDLPAIENAYPGIDTYPTEGEMRLKGAFGRWQGSVIFNVYPFPVGSFYVAAGAYFGGSKLVKITGHSDELDQSAYGGQVSIGDYNIPVDENGNVSGGLKVQSFRPYLGIGWGRAIPNRRLNFGVELGVQFHGTPKVYTDYGEVDYTGIDGSEDFQKIIDNVKVWPVLKLTLSGKIF